MKQEDASPPALGSDECSRRIRCALRSELDKRWGQVGDLHVAIGMSSEYLNKVCRGEEQIPLDRLLRVLELMGIDPGRFFAAVLGAPVNNDSLLEDLERFGEIHHRLAAIEKATGRIELSEALGPAPPAIDAEAMVTAVAACNVTEQRRRLGTARKYRHPAFAAAYLEHLDSLRYDNPKEAGQTAWVVAVKLIPCLPGSRRERIALQVKAIGVFASARRQKEDAATAARALRFALARARSHDLRRTTGELLQRGAHVLSGNGRYMDAMRLLDEALVISIDLDVQEGLGSVQVDRGIHFYYLGEYQAAVATLQQALKLPFGECRRSIRSRVVARQVLARSFIGMGDLEVAEVEAGRAVALAEKAGRLYRAYLLWDHGVIALERHRYDLAETRLREASQLCALAEDPNQAMVTLDLTKALVAQGETLEAVGMAVSAAEYLRTFRGNRVAAAAVSDLMQTAVEGRLSLHAIGRLQTKLEGAGAGMARNLLPKADRVRRSK